MPNKGLLLLASLLSSTAFAFDFSGHPYVGGLGGVSVAKVGQTYPKISYADASIVDNYPLNSNHSSIGIGGLYAGYEFNEFNAQKWKPAVAVGVGVYQSGQFDLRGQLIETTDGTTTTLYDYKYSISSTITMAEVQFTWMLGTIMPFVNLGLGSSINRSMDYVETVVNSSTFAPFSHFQSRTHAECAYQAGFGVSTSFNFPQEAAEFKHERLSLGYRFADLGTASLGTRGASYPYQLNVGQLRTYDVFVAFTHLF